MPSASVREMSGPCALLHVKDYLHDERKADTAVQQLLFDFIVHLTIIKLGRRSLVTKQFSNISTPLRSDEGILKFILNGEYVSKIRILLTKYLTVENNRLYGNSTKKKVFGPSSRADDSIN